MNDIAIKFMIIMRVYADQHFPDCRLHITHYTFVGPVTRAKKMCDGNFLGLASDLKKCNV